MSPQGFAPEEIPTLIRLSEQGELVELYRRSRVKIGEGRAAPSVEPGYNFDINRWALYTPDSTYFLPIDELTALYINTLLEALDKTMGIFVADERVSFRPAGTGRFARNRSGHLDNDPASEIGQRFELDPDETHRLFVEPKGDIRKTEFTDGDEESGWEAVALEHAPSVGSSSQDSSV